MSTDKHASKRNSTTKEKQVVSKTSTRTSSREQIRSKAKKQSEEDEKELTKKITAGAKDSLRTKNVPSKSIEKSTAKISKNISMPSKTSVASKTSTNARKTVNNTKTSTPKTSSSSRIKTTQYFPSKNLYSNALKSVEMQSKILEEGINIPDKKHTTKIVKTTAKTTPHSPAIAKTSGSKKNSKSVNPKSEKLRKNRSIKDVPNETNLTEDIAEKYRKTPRELSPETSSAWERPRTATLRKGSIVNANIVGPEAPKYIPIIPVGKENTLSETRKEDKTSPSASNSDDNNYEEDFESYESDFEADTSSDDINLAITPDETDNSMSSSAEDISEKKYSPASLQKDNKRLSSAGTDGERKLDSGTFELSDFKHRQILKYIEDTIKKEDAILEQDNIKEKTNHPSLSDEGFEDQKSLQFINFADAKKRCEKRRASAAKKKRGEELLSMIKLDAINFTIFDLPSVPYDVYIANYGRGDSVQASVQTGDDNLCEEVQTDTIHYNTKWTQMPNTITNFDEKSENFWHLYRSEFLGVGDEIVNEFKDDLMEVNELRLANFLRHSGELILQALSEEKISDLEAQARSKNELPFSKGYIQFNTKDEIFRNTIVKNLFIHPKGIGQVLTIHLRTDANFDFVKSMVCVWDINDLNAPKTTVVAFGEVCCSTFPPDDNKYILAGQKDGAILIWNIEEKGKLYNISNRTPSFISPIGTSHLSKVISILPVPEDQDELLDKPKTNEICTLDEAGTIIIWTFYSDTLGKSTNDVVLISTKVINLSEIYPNFSDLVCSDLIVMDNHIYVSTSYGFILHCLVRNNQNGIKMFAPETKIDATCLECCPFSPAYFLAGYANGDISLYTRTTDRPLLVLQNKEEIDSSSMQIIQWSKTKPFLLYAKDSKNTVHIWNLCKSDMYPEYSIPFSEKISSIKLSPVINLEREESTYMIIGTESGNIYFHLLQKEYGQESYGVYQEHVKTFFNYVNRL